MPSKGCWYPFENVRGNVFGPQPGSNQIGGLANRGDMYPHGSTDLTGDPLLWAPQSDKNDVSQTWATIWQGAEGTKWRVCYFLASRGRGMRMLPFAPVYVGRYGHSDTINAKEAAITEAAISRTFLPSNILDYGTETMQSYLYPPISRRYEVRDTRSDSSAAVIIDASDEEGHVSSTVGNAGYVDTAPWELKVDRLETTRGSVLRLVPSSQPCIHDDVANPVRVVREQTDGGLEECPHSGAATAAECSGSMDNDPQHVAAFYIDLPPNTETYRVCHRQAGWNWVEVAPRTISGPGFVTVDASRNATFLSTTESALSTLRVNSAERRGGVEGVFFVSDTARETSIGPWPAPCDGDACAPQSSMLRLIPRYVNGELNKQCDINPFNWVPTNADTQLSAYCPGSGGAPGIQTQPCLDVLNSVGNWTDELFAMVGMHASGVYRDITASSLTSQMTVPLAAAAVALPKYNDTYLPGNQYSVCFREGWRNWVRLPEVFVVEPGAAITMTRPVLSGDPGGTPLLAGTDVHLSAEHYKAEWVDHFEAKFVQVTGADNDNCLGYGDRTEAYPIMSVTAYEYTALMELISFSLVTPAQPGQYLLCLRVGAEGWYAPKAAGQAYSYDVIGNGVRWWVEQGSVPTNQGQISIHVTAWPGNLNLETDEFKIVAANASCLSDLSVIPHETPLLSLGGASLTSEATVEVHLPRAADNIPAVYRVCVRKEYELSGQDAAFLWVEASQASAALASEVSSNTSVAYPVRTAGGRTAFVTIPAPVGLLRHDPAVTPLHTGILTKPSALPFDPDDASLSMSMATPPEDPSRMGLKFIPRGDGGCGTAPAQLAEFEYSAIQSRLFLTTHLPAAAGEYILCLQLSPESTWVWVHAEDGKDHIAVADSGLFAEVQMRGTVGNVLLYDLAESSEGVSGAAWCGGADTTTCSYQGHSRDYLMVAPNTELCRFPPSPAVGLDFAKATEGVAWYYLDPDAISVIEVSSVQGVVLPPLGSHAKKFRICLFRSTHSATAVEGVYHVPLLGTGEAFWAPVEADPRLEVAALFNATDPVPVLAAVGYQVKVDGAVQDIVVSALRCRNVTCEEAAWPGEPGAFELIDTASLVETAQCERQGFGGATDGGLSKALPGEGMVGFELRQRTPCPRSADGYCAIRFGARLASGRAVYSDVTLFAALPPSTAIQRLEVADKFVSAPHPTGAACTPDVTTCHTLSVVYGAEDPVVIRPQTEVRYAVDNRYLDIDCIFVGDGDDDEDSMPLNFPKHVLLGEAYTLDPFFTPVKDVEVRTVRCLLQVQDQPDAGTPTTVYGPALVNFLVHRQTLKRVEITGLVPSFVDAATGNDGPIPVIVSPFPDPVAEFYPSPLEHLLVRKSYDLKVNSIGLFNRVITSDFNTAHYEVQAHIAHPDNRVEVMNFTNTSVTFQVHSSSGCMRKEGGCEILFEWHRVGGLGMLGFVTSVKLRVAVRTIGTSLRYHAPGGLASSVSRGVEVIVEAGVWCGTDCFIPDEFHVGDAFTLLRFPHSEDGLVGTNGFRFLTEGDSMGYLTHTLTPMMWHADLGIHGARMRLHGTSPCIGCVLTVHSTSGATLDPRSQQDTLVVTLTGGEEDLVCTLVVGDTSHVDIVAVDRETRRPALHPRWPLSVTTTPNDPNEAPSTTVVYLERKGRTRYPIHPGETLAVSSSVPGGEVLRCDVYYEAPAPPPARVPPPHAIVAPSTTEKALFEDPEGDDGYSFVTALDVLSTAGVTLFASDDEGEPFNITGGVEDPAAMFTVVAAMPRGLVMNRSAVYHLHRNQPATVLLESRMEADAPPGNYTFGAVALNITHAQDVKTASSLLLYGETPVVEAVFFLCTFYKEDNEACTRIALTATIPLQSVAVAVLNEPTRDTLVAGGPAAGCYPSPDVVLLTALPFHQPAEFPGTKYIVTNEAVAFSLAVDGGVIQAYEDYLGSGADRVTARPTFRQNADGTATFQFSVLEPTNTAVKFVVHGELGSVDTGLRKLAPDSTKAYRFARQAQTPAAYLARTAVTEDVCNVQRSGPVSFDGYRSFDVDVLRGWTYVATNGFVGLPFPIQTVVHDLSGERAWNVDGNKIRVTLRDPGKCGVSSAFTVSEYVDDFSVALAEVAMPTMRAGMVTPWVSFHSPCKDCVLEMAMCYFTASGPDSCLRTPGPSDAHPALPNRVMLTQPFSVKPPVPTLLHVTDQVLPGHGVSATGAPLVKVGEAFTLVFDTAVVFPPRSWAVSVPPTGRLEVRVVNQYVASTEQQGDLSRGLLTGGFLRPSGAPFPCGDAMEEAYAEHSEVFAGGWTEGALPSVSFTYTRPCHLCQVVVYYRFEDPAAATWGSWQSFVVRDAAHAPFQFSVETCAQKWGLGHAVPRNVRLRQPFVLTVLRMDGNGNPTFTGIDEMRDLKVNGLSPEAANHTDVRLMRRENALGTVYSFHGVGILGVMAERACYRCNVTFNGFTHGFSVLAPAQSLQVIPTAETELFQPHDATEGFGSADSWTGWAFEAYAADANLDLAMTAGGPTHRSMLEPHEGLQREGLAVDLQVLPSARGPFGFMAKVEGKIRWRVAFCSPIRLDLVERAVLWNGVVYTDAADTKYARNITNTTLERAVGEYQLATRPPPANASFEPGPLRVIVVPGSPPGVAEMAFTAGGAEMETNHGGRKVMVGAVTAPNYLVAGRYQETEITGTAPVRIPVYLLDAYVTDNQFSGKEHFYRSMENLTEIAASGLPPPTLSVNHTCAECPADRLHIEATPMHFGVAYVIARSVDLRVDCTCDLVVGYPGIENTVPLIVHMAAHGETTWEWVTPAEALVGNVMQSLRLTVQSGTVDVPPSGLIDMELIVRPDPAGCFVCAQGTNAACHAVVSRLAKSTSADAEPIGVSVHGKFVLPNGVETATCGVLLLGLDGRVPGYEFSVTAGAPRLPVGAGSILNGIGGDPFLQFLQSSSSRLFDGAAGATQVAGVGTAVLVAVEDALLVEGGYYTQEDRADVMLACGQGTAPSKVLYFEQRAGRRETMVFRLPTARPGMYRCTFTHGGRRVPTEYDLPALLVVGAVHRTVVSVYDTAAKQWAPIHDEVVGQPSDEAAHDAVFAWVSGYSLTLRIEAFDEFGVKLRRYAPFGQSSIVKIRSDRRPCLLDEAALLPYSCATYHGAEQGACAPPPAAALLPHTCVDPWWGKEAVATNDPTYVASPDGDVLVTMTHGVGHLDRGALQVSLPSADAFTLPLQLISPGWLELECSICQPMPQNAVGRTTFALLEEEVRLDVVMKDVFNTTAVADSVSAILFRIRCLSQRYQGTKLLTIESVPGTNATNLRDDAWADGWYHVPMRAGRASLSGVVFSGACPNGMIEVKCGMDPQEPGAPPVADPRNVCGRLLANESLQFGTAEDLTSISAPTAAPLPIGSPFVILNLTGVDYDEFEASEFEARFGAELNKLLAADEHGSGTVFVRYLCRLPEQGFVTETDKLNPSVCRYFPSSEAAEDLLTSLSDRRRARPLQEAEGEGVLQLEFVIVAETSHRNVFSAVSTVLAAPATNTLKRRYPGLSKTASMAFIDEEPQPTAVPATAAIPTDAPGGTTVTDAPGTNRTFAPANETEAGGRAAASWAALCLGAWLFLLAAL
eukprot:TRINITY_DN8046_c0_g2_i1.p1 TRINITY_DN8046_c0_g2~~TRINITY_DN8046_c0_g2_i1.p1  ORF type:complete len:4147 (+),score=1439.50 TRINITY_DN8046_c0_g2_i1:1650-12443(+)